MSHRSEQESRTQGPKDPSPPGTERDTAPSDRQVEISAFHIVRFSGSRIAEWWGTADLLGALQQLDTRVVPHPR